MTRAAMSKELRQILNDRKESQKLLKALLSVSRHGFAITELCGETYKVMFLKSS